MDLVNVKTVVSTGTKIQPKTNGQRKRTLGSYHIYIFHTPIQVARVSLVLNLLSQKGLPKGDKYS